MITLSKILPISAVELAKIAAIAGQLGIGTKGTEAVKRFTTAVALMTTATNMNAEEAGTAMAKVSNAFSHCTDAATFFGCVAKS